MPAFDGVGIRNVALAVASGNKTTLPAWAASVSVPALPAKALSPVAEPEAIAKSW